MDGGHGERRLGFEESFTHVFFVKTEEQVEEKTQGNCHLTSCNTYMFLLRVLDICFAIQLKVGNYVYHFLPVTCSYGL